MKLVEIAGILALSLLVVLAASCGQSSASVEVERTQDNQPMTVSVVRPEPINIERSVKMTGEFRPWQQADLHAKIAGYLKTLSVDVGAVVRSGQVIAVLEAPELEAERQGAIAAVARAKSEMSRSAAEIERAKARLEIARIASERLRGVNKKEPGLVAGQELDEAAARQRTAEAELASAMAAQEAGQQAVSAAQAQLGRVDAMLTYTRLIAPFDGTVTKRFADPGNMIQMGTSSQTQALPVVRIADVSTLRLAIVVPEMVVRQARVGTEVEIEVPATGKTFTGRIARFTEQVTTQSRSMEAEVDVPNPGRVLAPGMVADVKLKAVTPREVLALPVQAISRRGGQAYVMAVEGNVIRERRVETGLETAMHVQIVSGASGEDRVVTGNRSLLQVGQVVNVKEAPAS